MARPLLDLIYRIRRRLWRTLRWRTRGVKVMLFDEWGRLMLIRNTYGRTDLFVLPGGTGSRRPPPPRPARSGRS
jgi:hypothetical protein